MFAQSLLPGYGPGSSLFISSAIIGFAAGLLHKKVGDAFLNRARAGVGGIFVAIALLSAASVFMAG